MDTVIVRQIIDNRNSTDYIEHQKMALLNAYSERNMVHLFSRGGYVIICLSCLLQAFRAPYVATSFTSRCEPGVLLVAVINGLQSHFFNVSMGVSILIIV